MSPKARSLALRWFAFLAEAEAEVHAVRIEDVHFHEVGAVDSIVDICGAAIAMDLLAIDEIRIGPLRVGSGFVNTEHGLLPVPAPATSALLAKARAVLAADGPVSMATPGELLTPTGAAILLAEGQPGRPAMTVESVSYGFGQKSFPWPNALGLWIGTVATDAAAEPSETPLDCVVIETNIDDMNPQAFELLIERLFAAGALDVWKTPIAMKKERLATMVSVLGRLEDQYRLETLLLQESTTFGVRSYAVERRIAGRAWMPIATRFGEIRVKCKGIDGRVVEVAPEYDDVVAAARSTGATFNTVWSETRRLGEALVGRSLTDVIAEAESS